MCWQISCALLWASCTRVSSAAHRWSHSWHINTCSCTRARTHASTNKTPGSGKANKVRVKAAWSTRFTTQCHSCSWFGEPPEAWRYPMAWPWWWLHGTYMCKKSLSCTPVIYSVLDLSFSKSKPFLRLQLPHTQQLTAPPQFPRLPVHTSNLP